MLDARHQTDDPKINLLIGTLHWGNDISVFPPEIAHILPPLSWPDLISTDHSGNIWLKDRDELYLYSNNQFYGIEDIPELPISEKPDIDPTGLLNFGSDACQYQTGLKANGLEQEYREIFWKQDYSSLALDEQNHLWFYHSNYGLMTLDLRNGEKEYFGKFPGVNPSGIYLFNDGRIWVSNPGNIWEYQNRQWQQYILPQADMLFTHFAEDGDGQVYGATDTSVYKFQNEEFIEYQFLEQWHTPRVYLPGHDPDDCSYTKNYNYLANCYDHRIPSLDFHYESLYLGAQEDGGIIYINNHLIARLKDGKWNSFLFESFDIKSATIDHEGNIWIYTGEALLRLDPDVFDNYRGVPKETVP